MPAPTPFDPAISAREATRRILEHLRLAIFCSDRSQREIERRLGFSRGYLSQILGGGIELRVRHLLAVLNLLDVDPADFFAEVFPRRPSRALEILDDLHRRSGSKPMSFDLARLYALGIESLTDLQERLHRCEAALEEIARRDLFERSVNGE